MEEADDDVDQLAADLSYGTNATDTAETPPPRPSGKVTAARLMLWMSLAPV